MKTRLLPALGCALALSACGTGILWKTPIEGAALNGSPLPIAAEGNNLYQLFPVGTQLHLRKLNSAGKEQWQVAVDDTLANALTSPKLRATADGVVVGYQDSANKQVFLKGFDGDGNERWFSDLGEHASETLDDLTSGSNGTVTAAVRLSGTLVNAVQFDASGTLLWETAIPACYLLCVTTLGSDSNGNTLVANTEIAATKSYLLDSSGTQVWYQRRATGISTLGLVANKITTTVDGFALHHPFVSWGYDIDGTPTWSYSSGSQANLAATATSEYYVPGFEKISHLDSAGNLLNELDFSDQKGVRQIEWRDDVQRLIVLSSYETTGPEIDGTITVESGQTLSIYDATGARKARYTSKATQVKSALCTPYPQCTSIVTIPGESWSQFTTTADRKLVVSGLTFDSERFAKALKLP
ncbi:MAG: hypothetical protein R3F47_08535 [Gammaproteobacteria bacterium]